MTMSVLPSLAAVFARLSLLAVGGGNAIIPEMQHIVVDQRHWLTARAFLDLFAVTRATPGPGSTIVLLIGQKVAGLSGALVCAVAMYAPSCIVVFVSAQSWQLARRSPWIEILQRALSPIAIGLIYASAIVLARTTQHGAFALVCTVIATVVLAFTEISPLIVLAAGGLCALILGI
jgi:chromate transporter